MGNFSPSSGTTRMPLVLPIFHPLDEFYSAMGMALPVIDPIPADQVPQPYRALLAHDKDMTPTLEGFHQCILDLRVLRSQQRDDFYYREVALLKGGSSTPVGFGAIKINLSLFSAPARRMILSELHPLGHVLRDCNVRHSSKPKAFFRVNPDAFILQALGLQESCALYGRRNTLSDPQLRPLAEVVEILPPSN